MKPAFLGDIAEALFWIFRSWKLGYSVPTTLQDWVPITSFEDNDIFTQDILINFGRWVFLSPLLKRHGIHIYTFTPNIQRGAYPPSDPPPRNDQLATWPWPRSIWTRERDLDFMDIAAVRVWPGRTLEGRDVIIRLASGPVETDELKIFRRLNTVEARKDPRNLTLPVLRYLTIKGLVFVVLPRWQPWAFDATVRANKVSELLDLAEAFFEGLEFLHEKRIAHRDIYMGNTVVNMIWGTKGNPGHDRIRVPGEVKYAYIDFDASLILPETVDIRTVQTHRVVRRPLIDIGLREGLCNPFTDDVLCLAALSERTVRVVESHIPEIGELFDSIRKCEYEACPTASEVLHRFRDIRARSSQDMLDALPSGRFWDKGVIKG